MHVNNQTLKNRAKASLQGKYLTALLVCLISSVVTSGVSLAGTASNFSDSFTGHGGVSLSFNLFGGAGSLVSVLIGGALSIGSALFFLNLCDNRDAGLEDLFAPFKFWTNTVVMNLLITVFTFLWSLLFIIPGIVAALSYFAAPYILAEHPEIKASDAIKMSKDMMKGHRWELFKLYFSFIGWFILCILTAGIGFIFLAPFVSATSAEFFNEISGKNYEKSLNGEY